MCGIAGRISAEKNGRVDPRHLLEATRLLAHRGPDGEGFLIEHNVGLGHRRLAIVDLQGGAQPLPNEDRSVWVTYNGEIYNHLDLRRQLESRGHHFSTRSDTEVLVHGYEEWGDELPTRLRGMFAFAVWDRRRRRLLLARDRLGIKPLYWTLAGGDLVFASEIKSLFAFPDVRRELDPTRIPEYLALRYVPGPETSFRGIRRLDPGHAICFSEGRLRTWRFWDLPVEAAAASWGPGGLQAEREQFLDLLLESVRLRLMGDVPVGLFLSGGIDSTAVAWAMKQANPAALKSFSVGFEDDAEGELAYARMAAEAIGTEHREVRVSSGAFRDSMEDLAWHLDEPVSDGACIPLMHLAKRAWEEVVIVLSGEGADEALAGYDIYSKMLAIERARAMGGAAFEAIAGLALRWVKAPKIRRYLSMARKPLDERYLGIGRAFDDQLLSQAFGGAALEPLRARFAPRWEASRGTRPLNRMLYVDTKVWLPDDLLIKADKMTMAWAVELRVPFLDHLLLEHAWKLPVELKRKWGVGKRLLRWTLRGKIPEPILRRKKKGFPVPIGRWLRTSLYEACREELLASSAVMKPVLGSRLIVRLLEEHRSGRVNRTEELYALWVYEAWHRAFFSEVGVPRLEHRDLRRRAGSKASGPSVGMDIPLSATAH
jgi:asparagine synthase (glutamine-hydrolysing)